MRGIESEVEVERLVLALLINVFHGVTADELGRVTFFVDGFVIVEPVEHAGVAVSVIIQLADHRAILVIEATLFGPILNVSVSEMPLADDGRVVAGILEALWQQPFVGGQAVTCPSGDDDRLQPVTERVPSRHQRRVRGRAHWLRVKLGKLRAGFGEIVLARRLDVRAAVEVDILPAKIVSNDVNDIGFSIGTVS